MLESIKIKVDEEKWASHPRVLVGSRPELPESEKVTPELLKRREFRENKPFIPRQVHFNYEATRDTIRHFVNGIGDTNPLFRDAEYARKTKYGRIVAPGCFLFSRQWGARGSAMTGIHGWYSGGEWEWYRPVYAGTNMEAVTIIRESVEKKGRMAGGRSIYIQYTDNVYINGDTGEIMGKEHSYGIRTDRASAASAGKFRKIEQPFYTRDDWFKILELYDREEIRGAEPRYWEDVQVGDKLGPMIKGPLTVRDEVAWLMGCGGPFMERAHKIEFDYEMRHPKALEYIEETGEADIPELVHILDQFARQIGVERAYDYGPQRISWLCNLFTNWIGDDGFLWKMHGDLRTFNLIGDVTIFDGEVTKKYTDSGKCCLDIVAKAENQRGEISIAPHTSTVILPSRERGPVVYPDPAPELVEEVKKARPLDDLIREGFI
ncbi:MaoC family dehydratase N-terminal domain-containing protein [Chloroflexota bacterium]